MLQKLALLCFAMALPAFAEWHAGGYIGAAHTQPGPLTLSVPGEGTLVTFHGVQYQGSSFQSPLYYGVRGGYFFNRHFGLETEFTHLKVFAKTARTVLRTGTLQGFPINEPVLMNTAIQRFSVSHGDNLLLANVVERQDYGRSGDQKLGRVIVNARLGFGATIPHAESTIGFLTDEHYQVGRWAMQVAVGAELRLWRKLYWMAEYKFTHNPQRVDFAPSVGGLTESVKGTVEAVFNSHHGITGFEVHF